MKISIKREQNDACIGSAEREKFGTKFKKTFRFLSMAALALMGAIMTGCSSEDNIDNPQQPANNDNVVTLTATVGLDASAGTRALDNGGHKTFKAGDKIAVIYKQQTSGETMKAVSTISSGDGTKTATFTVTLTNPNYNAPIRYIYPAAMAKDPGGTGPIDDDHTVDFTKLDSQTGSLTDIGNNLDLSILHAASWTSGKLPSGKLENKLAILALTLKNNEGTSTITSSLTNVAVMGSSGKVYMVAPQGGGGGTFGQNVIYAAIQPETSEVALKIAAGDGTNNYEKTLTSRAYDAAGTIYNLALKMPSQTPPASPRPLLADATSDDIGKIVGSDGKIYNSKNDAAAALASPVAMIAYVGNASDCTKGLAIALENAGSSTFSQTGSAVTAFADTRGVTGGTWRVPTIMDWQYILIGCGDATEYNSSIAPNTNFGSFSGLSSKLSTAKGTALTGQELWASDSYSGNQGWYVWFCTEDGNTKFGVTVYINDSKPVRAVLAF